jgi:hypothetical protein
MNHSVYGADGAKSQFRRGELTMNGANCASMVAISFAMKIQVGCLV